MEGRWYRSPAACVGSSGRGMTMLHWSDVIFLLGYWLFAVAYSVKVLALLR